jgi:hypothetical protein
MILLNPPKTFLSPSGVSSEALLFQASALAQLHDLEGHHL